MLTINTHTIYNRDTALEWLHDEGLTNFDIDELTEYLACDIIDERDELDDELDNVIDERDAYKVEYEEQREYTRDLQTLINSVHRMLIDECDTLGVAQFIEREVREIKR